MKNRVAYFGVFTALALIFSYVETLIPINFGIPGVKLGLANLVIVIALYKMKLTEVYLLSVVRVLLSGFIFGNYFSIIYSLAGGLLSLTVMALLKKSKGFSVMGISVAGGVFHNVGQLIVAMLGISLFPKQSLKRLWFSPLSTRRIWWLPFQREQQMFMPVL